MNKVILCGRWSQEVELKFTQGGKAVASTSIAVDKSFGEGADFFPVTVWGKQAENVANYTKKGSKVLIEGRLEQESWDTESGKRYKTKVTAERVEFLDSKPKNNEGQGYENQGFQMIADDDDEIPF